MRGERFLSAAGVAARVVAIAVAAWALVFGVTVGDTTHRVTCTEARGVEVLSTSEARQP
jgi:hypothetical protein